MKKNFYCLFVILLGLIFVGSVSADTSVDYEIAVDYGNTLNQTAIKGFNYLPATNNNEETIHFKISTERTGNKIIYCSDAKNGSPGLTSGVVYWDQKCVSFSGNKNKSLTYIFENGYGSYKTDYQATEYLTGNYLEDYFITQVAAWYYTIPADWMSNFDVDNGTYYGKSNDVTQKISKLIKDAEKVATEEPKLSANIANSTMTLTDDKKYYISSPIKLTGSYLNSKINASVSGINGAFVTTNKDATSGMSLFDNGSTVYIKVSKDSVTSTTSKITLSISATSAYGDGRIIQCDFSSNDDSGIQAVIDYNPNDTTLSASVSVTASKLPVVISKKEITGGQELEGATLAIKSGSTVIQTWTSTTSPKTIYLDPGTYVLQETIAPDGYILSKKELEFTLSSDGKVSVNGNEVTEVVMTNEPIIVKISKRSIVGSQELEGATLRITDKEGNVIKDKDGNDLEWISTSLSREFNLPIGTYLLTEVIAPEGYELSDKTIEFTITLDGKVIVDGKEMEDNLIIFENTPEPEQVPTGSVIIYVAIALGVTALAVMVYLVMKKYQK